MKYKQDWNVTKKRYEAWWAGEVMDRCAISITSPLDNAPQRPAPVTASTAFERWTNLDYIAECNDYNMSHLFYGGEAFPIWTLGYPGHTAIPTFLGCELDLDFDTGWWHPIIDQEDLSSVFDLKINKDSYWWKFTIEALNRAVEESKGKCIPSIGAFGGCGDTLAAIRGTDRLLLDVIDRPEQVHEAEMYLMDMWFEVYDTFYSIITEVSEGSTCWFDLWSPGKFYAAQNDFAYMISPRMFSEIFIPVIDKQTHFLDHTVYHVDGIGNFLHIPALCELPKLQALQVLPGAGKPSPLHYMTELKYIQKAGKNLHITIPSNEVEPALKELSSKGLFIQTFCSSEAEARALLENTYKWSHI